MSELYYVNIAGPATVVKAAKHFIEQGGLAQHWGAYWFPVTASNVKDAGMQASDIRMLAPDKRPPNVGELNRRALSELPMLVGELGPTIPDAGWLNTMAAIVYAQNVERGWWDDANRCIYRTLQLVNTEIGEATEGDRKDLFDDHLPHRKMAEVEIADALIRALDLGGRYEWKYDPLIAPHRLYAYCPTLGARHLAATAAVCALAVETLSSQIDGDSVQLAYSCVISTLLRIARDHEYDLIGATVEKLEYNKTRSDHSREARAHFDGKKY